MSDEKKNLGPWASDIKIENCTFAPAEEQAAPKETGIYLGSVGAPASDEQRATIRRNACDNILQECYGRIGPSPSPGDAYAEAYREIAAAIRALRDRGDG